MQIISPLIRARVSMTYTRTIVLAAALLGLAAPVAHAQQVSRFVRGDVNGDGRVTAADALIVNAHLAGRRIPATADVLGRGDADGDGQITRADADLILRMVVGQDVSGTAIANPKAPSGAASLRCVANVRGGTVQCEIPQSAATGELLGDRILYGGQHKYVTLATSGIAVDSAARTFSFDLTVKNLLRQAIGTTDGATVDPEGVRVFFSGPIQTTAGSGAVEVDNPDGRTTFTASNQPYFQYNELLPTGAVSAAHRWQLRYDAGVEGFSFLLYISSAVQFPQGWVGVTPPAREIAAGETLALTDTVFNAVGTPQTGAPVTWSTSDAAIATVSATGVVTGVADGVATITATSGVRTGSMQVTVSSPSAVTSEITVAPDTAAVFDSATVTVRLRNASGTAVTRGGATVVVTTSLGTVTAVADSANGLYFARVTSPTVGTARIGGTLNGAAIADSATVEFTAGAPASYGVTSSADSVAAGGTITLSAQLLDSHGNPVRTAGSVVTWSSTGGGSFATPTSTTDASGVATVAFTADSVAGTRHTATATTGTLTGTSAEIVVRSGAAAGVVKNSADGGSFVAGGNVTPAPSVRVVDGFGNPVEGATVTFAVASGGGSVTGETQTTDAGGVATVGSWTLGTTAGANTLTATSGSFSVTFSATGTPGAPATIEKIAGDAGSFPAGTATTPAPSVRVKDTNGNVVPGATVTFAVASGGGSVTGETQTTDAGGVATVGSWTLGTSAGANTLTATSGTASTTFTATATAGAAANITKTAGDAQTTTAGGNVAIAPSVTVTDTYGNPVAGVSVTFAASGNGSVTGSPATTDAAGVATVGSWTLATTAGANTLTATAGALTTTFTATGTAGAPATVEKTAGDAQSASAGTAVATAPSVRVLDSNNNPVPGATVTFAVASGGGSVTGETQTTDASGNATVGSWTRATAAGANTLTATAGAASATFTATATAGAAANITKTAGDGQSMTAGGNVATAPSVTVTDTYGKPVAGVSVTFAASGSGSVTSSPATTDAAGVATVGSWTLATTAGANTLTATAGALTTTFTATGTAGASAVIEKTAGDGQSATAGTAVATAPSVRVLDSNNNPVPGATVTFTVATGGGSVTGGTQTTDASGNATLGSWTLGTTAGTNTLTVSSGAATATFTATATAGAPATIEKVAGDAQSATAGSAVSTAPSVRVLDSNNNPVPGATVTFAVASGGGSVTGETQTTNASGIATVGSWTLGTSAGANTLTATSGSTTTTFTATATAGAAANITKTAGDGQTATAGSAVATAPSVTVTDTYGNPVAGVSVTFAASGNGSVTGSPATTNAAGVATVGSWTLATTAGANTLTATAGALSTSFTATGTAGAAANITRTAGDAQTATAGTAVATAPSVTITDTNGNPVAGVTVTFAVASGGGTVAGETQTTNASGVATVGSWTLGTTAGANTLTATAGALTTTFTATATAGAAANITKTAGDGQTATAGSAVATAPSVTVTDTYGNPVAGVSVTFAASGNGSVTGSPATTDAAGVATVGSWTLATTAGANTLTATAGALTTSFTATGTAGAPATIEKTAGDAQSATVGTAVAIAPSVRVLDANSNPVAGVTVTFTVATGGGTVAGETQTTDASGNATVGSWTLGTTAGANTLTATAGALTTTFTATGTAAAAANITKTAGEGQSAVAGSAVATPPSVTVTDTYGNPVAGVSVTFAASGNGSVTGSPATTDAAGVAAVGSWTLATTAGADSLTATAGALSTVFHATATAGAPANITKTGPDNVSLPAGSVVTPSPSVTLTDANGNPVVGATVTFAVISGGGTVTGETQTTDSSGVATVTSWTLGTTTGADTLRATAGTLTADFSITAVAGPASAAGTQITTENAALTEGSITTITVQVADQYGNALTSSAGPVTLSSDLGTVGPVSDKGNGTYTADLTHTGTNGTATITGTLNGAPITDNAQVVFQAGGIQRTWTGGTANPAWNVTDNWSPRGLPMEDDTVIINAGGTQPSITDTDKTIRRLVMTSTGGMLNLGGHLLTITDDAVAPGGTISGGTVVMTGSSRTIQGTYPNLRVTGSIATSGNTTANGTVTVNSGSLTVNNQVLTITGS